MHPAHNKKLRAIVGEKSCIDDSWCDECMRWEAGYGQHKRPYQPLDVRALRVCKRVLSSVVDWIDEHADLAQARFNARVGALRSVCHSPSDTVSKE